MFRAPAAAAAACASALMAACGGGGGAAVPGGGCSATSEKEFVLDVARDWYLFLELLPPTVNLAAHADAQALLDALTATARAQGKDRFFSFLTTPQADSSFFGEGQFIGFGFRTRIEGNRLLLPDVFEGSPAAAGGLVRGAEITHVDSGSGFVAVATILQTDPNLEQAFGPATAGVQRGMRFVLPGGQQQQANFTKAVVTIPPLPQGGVTVMPMPGNPAVQVGYVNLRTFISTANTPLRNAYAQFAAQNIRYLIVDLRYNGGGLVSTADLMGDLHGDDRVAGADVWSHTRFNSLRASANDATRRFAFAQEAVGPVRIAFITTGSSASASELVINSLKPWVEVAIVGSDTFGKPVGQLAFDLQGCDLRLRLVSFRVTNADNEGDYYDGLAPTLPGAACAATDDLTRAPWDSAEASTAAALNWLQTGACGQAMAVPAPFPAARIPFRYPEVSRPTTAQANLPGLF
ncbi:MAG: S41 family peptidase [Gammaproteobacteria bacterium]